MIAVRNSLSSGKQSMSLRNLRESSNQGFGGAIHTSYENDPYESYMSSKSK